MSTFGATVAIFTVFSTVGTSTSIAAVWIVVATARFFAVGAVFAVHAFAVGAGTSSGFRHLVEWWRLNRFFYKFENWWNLRKFYVIVFQLTLFTEWINIKNGSDYLYLTQKRFKKKQNLPFIIFYMVKKIFVLYICEMYCIWYTRVKNSDLFE